MVHENSILGKIIHILTIQRNFLPTFPQSQSSIILESNKTGGDMNIITRLEEAILIAVWRLEDNAYGVTINKHVSRSFKKNYSLGSLYFSLNQLLRKGCVSKTTRHFYQKKRRTQPHLL